MGCFFTMTANVKGLWAEGDFKTRLPKHMPI